MQFPLISLRIIFLLCALALPATAEESHQSGPISRDQFLKSLEGGFVTEFGSFGTKTGDESAFAKYILANWSPLLDQLDTIPAPQGSRNLLIAIIGAGAEDLPPEEYLDFMDKYLSLAEEGKIPKHLVGLQLIGRSTKHNFLDVNWNHPRVREIFSQALKIFPDQGEANHDSLLKAASGKLADNYKTGASEDLPPPETLPGITLRPPDESFLEKLKKNVSRNDRENNRRSQENNQSPGISSGNGSSWLIEITIVTIIGSLGAFFRFKRRRA